MKTFAVYLHPRGSLASEIGSDTLFGAVCWALQILGLASVEELLRDFHPPRFAFSATFPAFYKTGHVLRFYPRPQTGDLLPAQVTALANALHQHEPSRFKTRPDSAAVVEIVEQYKRDLKKASYLSESLFRECIENGLTTFDLFKRIKRYGTRPTDIRPNGSLLFRQDDLEGFFDDEEPPPFMRQLAVLHNQIDRLTGSTGEGLLFFENETHFAPSAGVWCLVALNDDETQQWLRAAFRYLSDTGLGANRSVGKGHFDIYLGEEIALPDAGANANAFVVLSRYLPAEGEWQPGVEPLRYTLKTIWAKREQKFPRLLANVQSSPIYKDPVRMFMPGSIFPIGTSRDRVCGRLAQVVKADMNGGVPVWQSGLAIRVFAKIEIGEPK